MEDLNQVLRIRREKLAALDERGIEAFAYNFDPTHDSARAIELFTTSEAEGALTEGGATAPVRVGGRIVSWRSHGKSAFAHVENAAGQIQLYFRMDVLGEQSFTDLDLLDLGDWIGVEGPVFRTRMGEVTIRVESWTLLSKSLRPLPFGKVETDAETGEQTVHSGFADTAARYRQRYADLAVHPEVREVFRTRGRIVTELRPSWTPKASSRWRPPRCSPSTEARRRGPSSRPTTRSIGPCYLRIADELYLKRLIVGGLDRVYEISKDFRNEGIDRLHNPEFTMLEWYQAFADYEDQMDLVERMVLHVVDRVLGTEAVHLRIEHRDPAVEPPFPRIRLLDALSEALSDDVRELSDDELAPSGRGAVHPGPRREPAAAS